MKEVIIYTDGACSGNPGNGGYCAILIYGENKKIISGSEISTTNNKMELLAVIKGLEALKEPCKVKVFSDSNYVVEAFNSGWIDNWNNNGWKTSNKKLVKNLELWQQLISLCKVHVVEFIKVKGHADNEFNNMCDKIAVEEYKKLNN